MKVGVSIYILVAVGRGLHGAADVVLSLQYGVLNVLTLVYVSNRFIYFLLTMEKATCSCVVWFLEMVLFQFTAHSSTVVQLRCCGD